MKQRFEEYGKVAGMPHEMNMENSPLMNRMVEVHLLNGKRFLGKVRRVDQLGMTVYAIPLKVLETMPEGVNIREQLRSMLATLFFPFVNVEYVDIGGEPVGFDALFASWFGGEPLDSFFDYEKLAPTAPQARSEESA
jgi:hypothetical protein